MSEIDFITNLLISQNIKYEYISKKESYIIQNKWKETFLGKSDAPLPNPLECDSISSFKYKYERDLIWEKKLQEINKYKSEKVPNIYIFNEKLNYCLRTDSLIKIDIINIAFSPLNVYVCDYKMKWTYIIFYDQHDDLLECYFIEKQKKEWNLLVVSKYLKKPF